MPQTRQHIQGERAARPARKAADQGVAVSWSDMERFLDSYAGRDRAEGTIQWYRRGMRRFYNALPADKVVRYGTLEHWQKELMESGYTPGSVNAFLSVANAFLDYAGHREYQLAGQLRLEKAVQPELTRGEYLQLLRTAKQLGREKIYLLVKLFAATGLSVQELPRVSVEAVQEGKLVCMPNRVKQVVRLPECLRKELLGYAKKNGLHSGPVFLTRDGSPMNRTYVSTAIRRLCAEANVAEEKGNPRCLKRLYQSTRAGIENNVALLVEQAMERQLEQEQLSVGWE